MPAAEVTIGELLKDAGYQTACVGKWDVSSRKEIIDRMPNAQGFDYFWGALGANDKGVIEFHENNEAQGSSTDMSMLTRLYTDKAIDFLENRHEAEKPFLLYIAHSMMHTNIDASPAFKGKSAGGLYGDVVEEFDFETGRLLDTLDTLGLSENTLVIYTTDNGPWCQPRYYERKMGVAEGIDSAKEPEGWLMPRGTVFWGNPGALRGGKGSAYEAGSRVPCIVRWPGKVPAGRVSDGLWATIDFLPTFAALAGGKVPEDRIIDGMDQQSLLFGESEKGRGTYIYQHVANGDEGALVGIRDGKWKLLLPGRKPKKAHRYLEDFGTNGLELYDLDADAGETRNLASDFPEVAEQLRAALENFKEGDMNKL